MKERIKYLQNIETQRRLLKIKNSSLDELVQGLGSETDAKKMYVDNNGKRISDSNWLKRNVRVCKELKQNCGLTFGEGKSQTRTERLRPNERMRYEMANDVKSALKCSHSWKDFSNTLKAYGIRAEIKFRSGTHIPIITHSKLIMAMLIVIAFAFVFTIVLG